MEVNNMEQFGADQTRTLEQNFRELITERCRFCGFNKYLVENPNFEFPEFTENCHGYITIPGMFGGFSYFLEEQDGNLVLYAEQSSRMDHDSNDYLYYEIVVDGSRMLKGEEREVVRKKFWELAKKAHEKFLQEIKTIKEVGDNMN